MNQIDNIKAEIRIMRKLFNSMLDDFENELESLENKPISAKNSIEVQNAATDFQKIKTAEFTVPVIYADVLYYKPGELGNSSDIGREGAHVYYTPESISDPEYLETVKRSPVVVATHEKSTGEFNRDVDGWPTEVWFDDTMGPAGAVMVKGYVHGEENVKYVEQNRHSQDFGSSAYIDFIGVKRESGTTPNGSQYTAKTTKLVNNHIALLPNIRDRKNVILAMNSISEQKPNKEQEPVKGMETENENNSGEDEMTPEEIQKAVNVAVKNALNEAKEDDSNKKEMDDIKNSIEELGKKVEAFESKNSVKNAKNKKKAKNEAYAGEETAEEEAEEEKIEESVEEEESYNAKNAMPSQDMVKDISEYTGVTFVKTPSIMELASIVGITGKPFHETLEALNAKRTEIKSGTVSAQNSSSEQSGFQDLMKVM